MATRPDQLEIETLYFAAKELTTTDARREYLERQCADKPELRKQLNRLLAADAEAGEFLQVSALELLEGPPQESSAGDSGGTIQRIRDYHLLEEIGRGGMGIVYLASHERLGKRVALKMLATEGLTDDTVNRFARESRAVGQLDHPNIVRAMDAGEENGHHFLVTELVDGVNLSELPADRPLTVADACDIIRQAANGLQHAHQARIVHRDIKPANLMLTRQGVVKILDMGLAILHQDDSTDTSVTRPGQIMGTIDFISPEQCKSAHNVDHRADLYSLGCTMYSLLCGQPPFHSDTPSSIYDRMRAHVELTAQPISDLRSDVPHEVQQIISQLMEKRPQDRISSAGELAEMLKPFCAGAATAELVDKTSVGSPSVDTQAATRATAPTESVDASPKPLRRNRRRYWIAAACVLCILAAFGVIYFNTGQGTLQLTVGPDAEVYIDGRQITVQSGNEPVESVSIRVDAGKRQLEVRKDGFETLTREFRMFRDGQIVVAAELQLKQDSKPSPLPFTGHQGPVLALDVSPDGERLVSAGEDRIIRLWSIPSGKLVSSMRGHSRSIHDVKFSPDGQHVLSCGEDQTIRLWDVATGKQVMHYTGHSAVVASVDFLPDGERFISSSYDGSLAIWDVNEATAQSSLGYRAGQPIPRVQRMEDLLQLEGHLSWVRSGEVSPDGNAIVSAGNDTLVAIWDVKSGTMTKRFAGHKTVVADATFSPDQKRIVTAGFDNLALLWDVDSEQVIQTLKGHVGPVLNVLYVEDQIISSGQDQTIRTWDPESGEQVRLIETHHAQIMDMAYVPRTKTLFSSDVEGKIHLTRLGK